LTIKKAREKRQIPRSILIDEIRNYHIRRLKETGKDWRRFERGDGRNPWKVPYRDG
jgi:hypothetical protein